MSNRPEKKLENNAARADGARLETSSGILPDDAGSPGSNHISTLNEKALHSALKEWYTQAGDCLEQSVDGYIIDIRRGDLLIEIQTRNFSALKTKLAKLLQKHPVRLVYPVARQKWITRLAEDGQNRLSRRLSPKKSGTVDLFDELVYIPHLLLNPRFSLEVLLIEEEEYRRHDEVRGWRRKGWVTYERRLVKVCESRLFEPAARVASLLPGEIQGNFTTRDLARYIGRPCRLARKMVYSLCRMNNLEVSGKQGRAVLYRRYDHTG